MKLAGDLEVLFSAEQIGRRVREIGAQIERDYQGKELVLLGVLKGSFLFISDLARSIDLPLSVDFIGLSSYGEATESSGVVKITSDVSKPIENKHVVIVEDIVDTGLTLSYLQKILGERHPKTLRTACLLSKPSRRKVDVTVDYIGFTIEDRFVVGYGLDFAEQYRNLPHIAVLEP
jgi:hypoxanthine phosphoribosyltransferase